MGFMKFMGLMFIDEGVIIQDVYRKDMDDYGYLGRLMRIAWRAGDKLGLSLLYLAYLISVEK
jgi:hypothetical protein